MQAEIEIVGKECILKKGKMHEKGFGEEVNGEIVLSPFETVYLAEHDAKVYKHNERLDPQRLKDFFSYIHKFNEKYIVFRDLRKRGYVVKSGFKFGSHFRVYPKGKKPGEAHTKYIVDVTVEGESVEVKDLSRFARIARSIRATPLIAVVLENEDVVYYKIEKKEL